MKITKDTLRQLIKEELEVVTEVSRPVPKAKLDKVRYGMADNHRRILRLIKMIKAGMRYGAGPQALFAMLNLTDEILRNSDELHYSMLEIKKIFSDS